MAEQTVRFRSGERLELWLRNEGTGGDAAFRLSADGKALHEVRPGDHFARHSLEVSEAGPVLVEWDADAAVFGYAYSYVPGTVMEEGITLWEFGEGRIETLSGAELDRRLADDPRRPAMHFSPPRFWTNDPNGLCRVGGRWHLFNQFHPCGMKWGPMHWGHAVSSDLFSWTHLPVFLRPERNLYELGADGGAFSGSAFLDGAGEVRFSYTERLPFTDENDFTEVQKIATSGDLVRVDGIRLAGVTQPPGAGPHFRDPRVVRLEEGGWRMVVGSILDDRPVLLMYGSDDLEGWEFMGPLYVAPERYRREGASSIECPDLIAVGGRHALLFCMIEHEDPETGMNNPALSLVGDFDGERFEPAEEEPQALDFGGDFYAMQSFLDPGGDRAVAMAWVNNWAAPGDGSGAYAGEMSLPRELSLTEDGRRLRMLPAREIDEAWPAAPLEPDGSGGYALAGGPFDVSVAGIGAGDAVRISATGGGRETFAVELGEGRLSLTVPGDGGPSRRSAAADGAADLRVVFDRGIVEVFAAGGGVCGTRRVRESAAPDRLAVEAGGGEVRAFGRRRAGEAATGAG